MRGNRSSDERCYVNYQNTGNTEIPKKTVLHSQDQDQDQDGGSASGQPADQQGDRGWQGGELQVIMMWMNVVKMMMIIEEPHELITFQNQPRKPETKTAEANPGLLLETALLLTTSFQLNNQFEAQKVQVDLKAKEEEKTKKKSFLGVLRKISFRTRKTSKEEASSPPPQASPPAQLLEVPQPLFPSPPVVEQAAPPTPPPSPAIVRTPLPPDSPLLQKAPQVTRSF